MTLTMTNWKLGKPGFVAMTLAFIGIAGCEKAPSEPVPVFPDAPEPTTFTRAFSLAESPDGQIRLFARENGDATEMYESVKGRDGTWSEPKMVEGLPHSIKLSGPAFDPVDGTLYFASDEPLEIHKGRRESNIWTSRREGGAWVDAKPLPPEINTGATETSPAVDEKGRLYFATNHSRAGGGGLDIMEASRDKSTGEWTVKTMPSGVNSPRVDDHLAVTKDGNTLFFYSHRMPKLGVVDIWKTTRGVDGEWQAPEPLAAPVNSKAIDFGAGISADGETFFFSRDGVIMSYPMKAIKVREFDTSE